MKHIYLIATLLFLTNSSSFAQEPAPPLYHPEADAKAEVHDAMTQAATQHKNVMLMIGGNWCRWCKMFDKMVKDNADVDSTLTTNFVFAHINFSKENRNLDLMTQWNFPQRFGFPVFVVLNDKGECIHTQNSSYLEEGEGYNTKTVKEFFSQWGPAAMNPELYKK